MIDWGHTIAAEGEAFIASMGATMRGLSQLEEVVRDVGSLVEFVRTEVARLAAAKAENERVSADTTKKQAKLDALAAFEAKLEE